MMPLFRALTLEDLNECSSILQELETHYDHPIGGEWTSAKVAQELSDHHGWGVFGAEDGQMQAFCLFRKIPDGREIMLLATRPRHHRTGAMRALIRSVIGDLADNERLWLEVHSGNIPAISLYESLGFEQVGVRKDYYYDGGAALLYEYKPLQ